MNLFSCLLVATLTPSAGTAADMPRGPLGASSAACERPGAARFILAPNLVLAGLGSAARQGGHRLPAKHTRERKVPEDGWNTTRLEHLEAMAAYFAPRTLQVEALFEPGLYPGRTRLSTKDGAGAIVAEGRLLTTAGYLEDAREVRLVRRDGRRVDATVERIDPDEGLAVLAFDPADVPSAAVVEGFAGLPHPTEQGGASEVVLPMSLAGISTSIRVAAALEEDDVTLISGQAYNGLPVFDLHGRLVALVDYPTPDRGQSVAVTTEDVPEWLNQDEEQETNGDPEAGYESGDKKEVPAENPRGPGP